MRYLEVPRPAKSALRWYREVPAAMCVRCACDVRARPVGEFVRRSPIARWAIALGALAPRHDNPRKIRCFVVAHGMLFRMAMKRDTTSSRANDDARQVIF